MKKYKLHIVWGILVVAALALGFFWGRHMASGGFAGRGAGAFALSSSTRAGFAGRSGGFSGGNAGGGFVSGEVTAIDSDSMTLQLPNGNSQNIFFSSSTQIIEPQPASLAAVKQGANVIITGTADASGNLTATTIQLRSTGGTN
jgi:hypothetical protein